METISTSDDVRDFNGRAADAIVGLGLASSLWESVLGVQMGG